MKRIHVTGALLSLFVIVGLSFAVVRSRSTTGQPGWDGMICEVPDRVLVYPVEGRLEFKLRKIDPVPVAEANEKLPRWVEVFTVFPDGQMRAGTFRANFKDKAFPMLFSPPKAPVYIAMNADGSYKIGEGGHIVISEPAPGAAPPRYPPGHAVPIKDTEYVSVNYMPGALPDARRRKLSEQAPPGSRANFGYYFESNVPFEITQRLSPGVGRSQTLTNDLLQFSAGNILVAIDFVSLGNNNITAETLIPTFVVPYQTVRNSMINFETQMSSSEEALLVGRVKRT
ncbi:MAG: hypothetical protein IT435_09885 [Phycisphaerales bacterium]|nr:hypothetical protein [Phycisphaerales bacterium]